MTITTTKNPTKPTTQDLLAPVRGGLRRVEAMMKSVESSLFAPLATAFVDLIDSGGKRIRPAIALMAAEFNGPIQETPVYSKALALAAAVEMLHTATLVHDDVIDGALLRRGAPTLNANWNQGATVMAGNYMFGQAARFAAQTEHMPVIRLFSTTLQTIVNGELHQLSARHDYRQERSDYYQRIYAKTASLFSTATECTALLSGLPSAGVRQLKQYGYHLGMAFQIVDDILDFTGSADTLGKPAGSDLSQGTVTLPFFYFLQQHPNPAALIQQLEADRQRAEQEAPEIWQATVRQIVEQLCQTDTIDRAYREAEEFAGKAHDNLARLPDNAYRQAMLNLCDFVVRRRS